MTAEARAEQAAERGRLLARHLQPDHGGEVRGRGPAVLDRRPGAGHRGRRRVYVTPDVNAADTGAALPPEVVSLSGRLSARGRCRAPRPTPAPWDGPAGGRGTLIILPVDESTCLLWLLTRRWPAWLRAAESNSIAVVPLVVAGTLSGALVLLAGGERPAFAESDLPFLQDVTARAGDRHEPGPHHPPAPGHRPGPAARPAATGAARADGVRHRRALRRRRTAGAVGGDWWDVQAVGAGHVAVGIGDVAGRGIRAAAVMGHARAAMRAAGRAALAPAAVLELLDAQLAEVLVVGDPEGPTPQFATACYAIVAPRRGSSGSRTPGTCPCWCAASTGACGSWPCRRGRPWAWASEATARSTCPSGRARSSPCSPTGWWSPAPSTSTWAWPARRGPRARRSGQLPGLHRGPPSAPDGTPARRQPRRRRVRPAPAGWGLAGADPPTDIGRPRRGRAGPGARGPGPVVSPRAGRTSGRRPGRHWPARR